jgi:uncharacterized protein
MQLERYTDIRAFYEDSEAFLLAREAENNLLLGITSSLIRDGWTGELPIHAAVVRDAGQIVAIALRTPPHNVVVSSGPPDALDDIVSDVLTLYPTIPGVIGPRDASRVFAAAWQRRTGKQFSLAVEERIYQLDHVMPVSGVAGHLTPIIDEDRPLIVRWLLEFGVEAYGAHDLPQAERLADAYLTASSRRLFLWHDDCQPVSMAGYAGPTPNGMRVTAVYTPPAFRGCGYASACIAALSRLLLDSGRRYCFLFTDLSNQTSNRIYQRVGYQPVVDVDEYRFVNASTT